MWRMIAFLLSFVYFHIVDTRCSEGFLALKFEKNVTWHPSNFSVIRGALANTAQIILYQIKDVYNIANQTVGVSLQNCDLNLHDIPFEIYRKLKLAVCAHTFIVLGRYPVTEVQYSSSNASAAAVQKSGPNVIECPKPCSISTVLSCNNRSSCWDNWTEWSYCTATCGMCGMQQRIRTCLGTHPNCQGDTRQTRPCASSVCPLPGEVCFHDSINLPCSVVLPEQWTSGDVTILPMDCSKSRQKRRGILKRHQRGAVDIPVTFPGQECSIRRSICGLPSTDSSDDFPIPRNVLIRNPNQQPPLFGILLADAPKNQRCCNGYDVRDKTCL